LTIDDLSTIWARVDVEEADLASIKVGRAFLNVILFFRAAPYPVESFTPWLRAFAHYNPETHAVSALSSQGHEYEIPDLV
jgi:hypothetical protein